LFLREQFAALKEKGGDKTKTLGFYGTESPFRICLIEEQSLIDEKEAAFTAHDFAGYHKQLTRWSSFTWSGGIRSAL